MTQSATTHQSFLSLSIHFGGRLVRLASELLPLLPIAGMWVARRGRPLAPSGGARMPQSATPGFDLSDFLCNQRWRHCGSGHSCSGSWRGCATGASTEASADPRLILVPARCAFWHGGFQSQRRGLRQWNLCHVRILCIRQWLPGEHCF